MYEYVMLSLLSCFSFTLRWENKNISHQYCYYDKIMGQHASSSSSSLYCIYLNYHFKKGLRRLRRDRGMRAWGRPFLGRGEKTGKSPPRV